ncbi:MAG: TIGR04086 family membrane protein [Christensenellales bacterium]|jgi:putative membrane protein (TIGR04086 family)
MRKNRTAKSAGSGDFLRNILLGVLPAIIMTIAAILIFALFMKLFNMADDTIAPVNQIIKIFGLIIAAFIASRKAADRKWLNGALAGCIYTLIGFLVFSLLSGSFVFSVSLLTDIIMGFIIGLIVALIVSKFIDKK